MNLVIKLNNSESLAFFGLFGVFFALPNYYQLLIEKLFPTIIENATSNLGLFKFLYIVALLLITYESYHWVIQLANNMDKTRNLNVDYKFYIAKIVFFGILGIALAIFLNNWLF